MHTLQTQRHHSKVAENVMPHLAEGRAETLQSKMNGAVVHLTVAVEKVDNLDQLVEKLRIMQNL